MLRFGITQKKHGIEKLKAFGKKPKSDIHEDEEEEEEY